MAHTAAELLIDTIHDWGVDVVFGLPGDGINGIMEGLRRHADRVWHVHFKDHDLRVAEESRRNEWDAIQSVEHGVFCELGRGDVDFPAIIQVLNDIRYNGWVVVEQDVLPGMGAPKESAWRNRDYLKTIGL